PMAAIARVLVRVPDFRLSPSLADLAFQCGHGTRADYASRLYGLLNDSLHVRTTLFGHGPYRVHLLAADRDGEIHWRDSLQVDVDGARDLAWSKSVNEMPAGQYVLQVTAAGRDGGAVTARSYDVAWSLVTWTKPRRDVDLEAELALSEEEYERYRT